MKIMPSYFKRFQCTASACSDNCCIGWEIDIDEETAAFYRKAEGAFGERLRKGISQEGEPHFILKGERCPFLNDQNLCDIIIHLGEEHLCGICKEHPRFYQWYEEIPGLPDRTEAGIGLCCEEGARLLFENPDILSFETEWENEEEKCRWEQMKLWFDQKTRNAEGERADDSLDEAGYLMAFFYARKMAFFLLQDRKRTLPQRTILFLMLAEDLQDCLDSGETMEEIAGEIRKIADCFKTEENLTLYLKQETQEENGNRRLEKAAAELSDALKFLEKARPLSPDWPKTVRRLRKEAIKLLRLVPEFEKRTGERDYEYEHLMVYFVYRYFCKAAFDGDLLSRAKLAVFSAFVLRLLELNAFLETGEVLPEQRILSAKAYSKETEYSEENLKALCEAFWETPFEGEKLMNAAEMLWRE